MVVLVSVGLLNWLWWAVDTGGESLEPTRSPGVAI